MADPATTRARLPPWMVPALVALCCLVTFLAKSAVIAARTGVEHGDAAYYVNVARNLAAGRGFVIDYIWSFWGHPEGIPTPSNFWWMPMASLIAAAGMRLGDGSYASAQIATTVFSSLVPLVTYLLGRDLFRSRATGLAAAVLSATFHLFLNKPSIPLSHSPYVVFATLTLWLILRSVERPRLLLYVGASIALTQLSRSDGILLFAATLVAHGSTGRRPSWRHATLLLLGYAVVMSPWWARNLTVFGAIQPGGSFRALFLSEYEAWYSLPESVTLADWLANGWGPVFAHKASVGLTNLHSFAVGAVEQAAGPKRLAWDSLAVVVVMALAWIGLLMSFRKRCAFIWTHIAVEWAFYSLLFTAVGIQSFRCGMFSIFPFQLVCAARAVEVAARTLRHSSGKVVLATLIGVLALGQYRFARTSLATKSWFVARLNRFYEALDVRVLEPYGLRDATFMARDVHELHAITGVRCVQIPYEDEPVIRQTAERYGVTHLLLIGDDPARVRPGLQGIDDLPGYERLVGPVPMQGFVVRIYALTDPG